MKTKVNVCDSIEAKLSYDVLCAAPAMLPCVPVASSAHRSRKEGQRAVAAVNRLHPWGVFSWQLSIGD